MTDKDFVTIETPHLSIDGRSRAGHETWFRVRELNAAFDIGRCPDQLVGTPHIFVTHAHLDHAVGIPFYAGQRQLHRMEGGRVYVPTDAAGGMREILAIYERITGASFAEVEILALAPGDMVRLGRTHEVRAHRATHRVAANAYEVIEVRHRLRDEFAGRDERAITELRRLGVSVNEEWRRSMLFYTGDTDRGILEQNEALFKAEVLMIECSFILPGHEERAAKYRHIHFDDIAAFADRFENETIVLTHFSRRYSRSEIHDEIRRRCPPVLRERIRLALPEPYQRL
ncbi:MAG TPA: MBL fold metallo-hydrolase [Thermoanaerobaculia bacterium]|jgi:ribonuclease Z|nr:MBL fold metallo-hydrolase [Thermoanaerobaculia bacterium]